MTGKGVSMNRPAHSTAACAASARRTDIIAAARALYEEKGLSRTTVQDITNRVGVTRTLFYHYFPDKDAVTSAVLDDYVADFIEALHYWNAQRRTGDIEHALLSVAHLMRTALFEHNAFRASLATKENATLYLQFLNRVAESVTAYMVSTTVRDYGARHTIRIDHVHETFYVLIVGIAGYMRNHPDAPDELIADLIAQGLHMDRGNERSESRRNGG